MWEGNLLPFDRFQQKKITIMWEGNLLLYYLLTDSRQKNNYNYVRGQFTTFWQIPDKKNNYNHVRGNLLHFDRFQTKKIITIMWEIYYLLTDSRKKNYNYARGQFTTYWQIPDK